MSSDWIEHRGNECPIHPRAIVAVKLRNGKELSEIREASKWCWFQDSSISALEIVAYRLVRLEEAKEKMKPAPVSNVRSLPLNDDATVDQLLIRAQDRNRDEKWKNAVVIWTNDDNTVSYLTSRQLQMETLFSLELIKMDVLGVPRT